jgi:hypothetical protein
MNDLKSRNLSRNRNDQIILIFLSTIIISVLLFVPVMYHMIFVFTRTDFIAHGMYIQRIYQTHSLIFDGKVIANPLFSILSLVVTRIFSLDFQVAELIVLTINFLLIAMTLTRYLVNQSKPKLLWLLPIIVLSLLIFFPIVLSIPQDYLFPYGYIPVTSYHNPTVWLARLFSLWSMLLFIQYSDDLRVPLRMIILFALVNICSILSKPNYMMCFLPAVGLFILYQLIKKNKINWKFQIFRLFLPSTITLAWQYWLRYQVEPQAGLTIAPLVVAKYLSGNGPLLLQVVLGALFPITVLILSFRRVIQDKWMMIAWVQYFIGLVYFFLLSETGPRQFDGNFLWGAEIALFVLCVLSANSWLSRRKERESIRDWIPWIILFIHGVFGIGYWYSCLTIV